MNDKLRDEQTDRLFAGILALKDIDECYAFFTDLCTISEVKSMAQRFHVATMLKKGVKYSEICKETGVSSATISRVNRCLEYGMDGYNLVLERLDEMDEVDPSRYVKQFGFF